MKKLRIVLLGGNFVEAEVPEDFNLALCGHTTAGCAFFCNGQFFIPYGNIEAMFVYDPATQTTPVLNREKMN